MTPIPRPLVSLVVGINIIHFMNVHGYLLGEIFRYDPLSSRSAMSYFNSIRETKTNNQTHKEITILFFCSCQFHNKIVKDSITWVGLSKHNIFIYSAFL